MNASTEQWLLVVAFGVANFSTLEAVAQDSTRIDASLERSEEEFLELIDDDETAANAAEILSWLRENPIDLNSAQRDDLLSVPGITGEEADAIIRLRDREGTFGSVEEIRRLPGGGELVTRLRPYVIVQHSDPARRPIPEFRWWCSRRACRVSFKEPLPPCHLTSSAVERNLYRALP